MEIRNLPELTLVTASYPFSAAAEGTFLEIEIQKLSKSFRVTVAPQNAKGINDMTFEKAYKLDLTLSNEINRKENLLVKSLRLFSPKFVMHLIKNLKSMKNRNYFWRAYAHLREFQLTTKWFKSTYKNSDELRIFYGWWLTPAILAVGRQAQKTNSIVIARAHGYDLYEDRELPEGKPFRKENIRNIQKIFPDSIRGTEYLLSKYPSMANAIETSHLGVPDYGLNPDIEDGKFFRIVSCSILDPIKRIPLIIESIAILREQNPQWKIEWLHFGDGPLRESLEEHARKYLKSEFRITSYPGIKELRRFYKFNPTSIFINTSKSEGVPVAMMEAASFGIPLIGPDVGGVSEIVLDGENGLLVLENTKPEDIAVAMATILKSNNYAHFREASRRIWSEKFDADLNYTNFTNYLLTLFEAKKISIRTSRQS